MSAKELLIQKGIDFEEPVLKVTREDALESIMEAIQEFCPSVKVAKMSKEDLEKLVDGLGESIVNYHPEDYHQERSALLDCSDILKKYGLTDGELEDLDFC